MNSLLRELAVINTEIYKVSAKWHVTGCRSLNTEELQRIKSIGKYATPKGIEFQLKDGTLKYIPEYTSFPPYNHNDVKIIYIARIGEPTLVRAAFSAVPIEVHDFRELENKYCELQRAKDKLIKKLKKKV